MSDPSPRPLPGLPRRILAVFVSPGNLFEQLRHTPVWGSAVLLVVVVGLVTVALMPAELFEDQIRRSLQQAGADTGEMPIETMVTIGRFSGIAVAGVMGAVLAFAIAAVMLFVFATLLGDNGRYRQYLSVVSHALIVSAVGSLLVTPLRIVQGDMQLVLSIGTFLPFLEDGALRTFLNMLDLFTLWAVALAALGASRIQPGRSWGGAFMILAVIWLAFSGGMAALTSLGS